MSSDPRQTASGCRPFFRRMKPEWFTGRGGRTLISPTSTIVKSPATGLFNGTERMLSRGRSRLPILSPPRAFVTRIDPAIPLPDPPIERSRPPWIRRARSRATIQRSSCSVNISPSPSMPAVHALRAIFDYCAAIRPDDSAAAPRDAVGTFKRGAAGSLGVSRLFMALARQIGLPARLVTGLVVAPGGIMDSAEDRDPVSWGGGDGGLGGGPFPRPRGCSRPTMVATFPSIGVRKSSSPAPP